ncbi:CDP-glycerol glycerophosphotransferase (TagB/SpsB family) [Lederbergia galactosidilyticus]|uniref:CDP-glycerol glycerophosphotransferase family protein n=1 Tax=Lederbergia galactosidilytica TaxID=217031 RepID=UPI001AE4C2D9|nr:CDP-glycerol glycerophosphotransferase family protein [Lederbergia galactosidilytica]MBP1915468.1 CDP-glycerol glycerophosphotransferase (TagB/SpsB family) [Lederbergia galactosidilytica]
MEIYDSTFEVIENHPESIELYSKIDNKMFAINILSLTLNVPKQVSTLETDDKMFLKYFPRENVVFYLYSHNDLIYCVLEEEEISADVKNENYYIYHIENFYESTQIEQLGALRIGMVEHSGEVLFKIDDILTNQQNQLHFPYDMGFTTTEFRYTVVSIISYSKYNIVITYDLFRKEFIADKIFLKIVKPHKDVYIKLLSKTTMQINTENASIEVKFASLSRGKSYKLFNQNQVKGGDKENILSIISINKTRYYIFNSNKGIYMVKGDPYKVTGNKSNLRVFLTKRNLYVFGRLTHYAYRAHGQYEYLYLQNADRKIGKFFRPFRSIKYLQRFGLFKIPVKSLIVEGRIHNNLLVGDKEIPIHNLRRRNRDKKAITLSFQKHGEQLMVVRTNLGGNLTATVVPFSEEYKLINRFKIKLAHFTIKLFSAKTKNVNLYFEKKSEKADESGFRVFEEVMKQKPSTSENYFIINSHSSRYAELKKIYGTNIIAKYSYKHYLNIFRADYFIASELSNHLLNDRLYIDEIRSKIMSVPLIFLQHGIMFAKPVDNPMAFGFHKDKNLYNMHKSVISSELEANEFYKMGYSDQDLLLTGLATLDFAKLDENANKIAYMPTYRYWEEALIYNNEIKKTSYYKSIMKVVGAFEKAQLLDRLIIVPHNKFSQFIYENIPEYKDIIESNPSEALKKAQVFITDYSSAIYDATFRGAYPIFYWEEKDYLITNYKAIPPVNDQNAPGPIAYSTEELIKFVRNAISRHYVLEEEYRQRYLKINKFDDRKNTKRIVQYLIDENII